MVWIFCDVLNITHIPSGLVCFVRNFTTENLACSSVLENTSSCAQIGEPTPTLKTLLPAAALMTSCLAIYPCKQYFYFYIQTSFGCRFSKIQMCLWKTGNVQVTEVWTTLAIFKIVWCFLFSPSSHNCLQLHVWGMELPVISSRDVGGYVNKFMKHLKNKQQFCFLTFYRLSQLIDFPSHLLKMKTFGN